MSYALLFPGQGSQKPGMLDSLAQEFPIVRETFAAASERLDYDLWHLVANGSAQELKRTSVTQPAMLSAGVAIWRVWREQGAPPPAWLAGHSLGEYTALVCAEVLEFEAAVELVAMRGRLMQEAVPPGEGAMLAIIGLPAAEVEELCRREAEGTVLEPANFNAPDQVVIAGAAAAVRRAARAAVAARAKAVPLALSVPAHCSLLRPAAARFREHLERLPFGAPRIPVLRNIDACPHATAGGAAIREALLRQFYSPVRWVQSLRALLEQGVQSALECGPGRVLEGLCRRLGKPLPTWPMDSPGALRRALERTAA